MRRQTTWELHLGGVPFSAADCEPELFWEDPLRPDSDLAIWRQVVGYRYAQFSLRAREGARCTYSFRFTPRWFPRLASRWDVLQDGLRPRERDKACSVWYSFPLQSPGFMTVQYLVCGRQTPYATLRKCVELVSRIANARGCQAVVCQAISDRLTERVMNRWGYVRHAETVGPNHYILRLKSGL
jgi:hypothetical protein